MQPKKLKKESLGYSLIELMIVLVIASIVSALVLVSYVAVKDENNHNKITGSVSATIDSINHSYASEANFRNLSIDSLISDRLLDDELDVSSNGMITGAWGGELRAYPFDMNLNGSNVPFGGFAIDVTKVNAKDCNQTVSLMKSKNHLEIIVNQVSLGIGKDISVVDTSNACNQQESQITFKYHRLSSNESIGICQVMAPETRTFDCPSGMMGSIEKRRNSICPNMYGEPVWDNWNTIQENCSGCPTGQETRTVGCPPGQYGSTEEKREFQCDRNTWGAWNISIQDCRTCPEDEIKQEECPLGQSGEITYRRVFYCNAGRWSDPQIILNTCS